jgi:uncharacterized membrane protein YeiH
LASRSRQLVLGLDLAGTGLFALEGAAAAAASNVRLDMLGILVIAFVTALGGGIIRDVLIGATPPTGLRDWRYLAIAFGVGLCAFGLAKVFGAIPLGGVLALDAAGLSLFAISGAEKTLELGLGPLTAVLMGGVTGVGGGVIRDLLLGQTPRVLTGDIYATAALFGAAVLILARRLGLSNPCSAGLGAAACFALRMIAVALHWNLPHLR